MISFFERPSKAKAVSKCIFAGTYRLRTTQNPHDLYAIKYHDGRIGYITKYENEDTKENMGLLNRSPLKERHFIANGFGEDVYETLISLLNDNKCPCKC